MSTKPLEESNEITTNNQGGKQSKITEMCSELPPYALLKVAEVCGTGAAKYGSLNWHKIPVMSEMDHALRHGLRFLAYWNAQADYHLLEEELSHFTTRAIFALDQLIRTQPRQQD